MMDYDRLFSEDTHNFMRSPVRDIFKKVDLSAICSFAGGYPDPATFPLERVKTLVSEVIDRYGATALQYGGTQGVPPLREAISRRYGVPLENLLVSTSSQQGIDVCTRILTDPGDVILTTSPTYLGAIQSFRSYRAEIVSTRGFTEEDAGVSPEVLARAKFFYVIPDFQNPSGTSMSLKERQDLCELSRKYGFMIVEDAPYRELRYSGEVLPTVYSMAPERTLHLGTFSKIFAPGFRLGWIFGPEKVLDKIFVCKQSLDLCPPILDQYMAAEFLSSGEVDRNLAKSIDLYRRKRDMMLGLLEKYMPEGTEWTRPEGGLFLFLSLPEGMDTMAMNDMALKAGVAYVSGALFYPDQSHRNTMRLNFSFIDEAKMEPGIRLLSELVKEAISGKGK